MEILSSAFRPGISTEEIQHALRHAVFVDEVAEDPTRYLVLGSDLAGRFLELVVMDRVQGPAVIHAMAIRATYERLVPKGGNR